MCSGDYGLADGGYVKISFGSELINMVTTDSSGNYNSINGFPAVIDYSQRHVFEWFKHGKRHNDNGPAVIRKDDMVEWWINGKMHSEQSYKDFFKDVDVDQKKNLTDMMDTFD